MLLHANGPISLEHTLGSGQAFRWRRDAGLRESGPHGDWRRDGDWWLGVVEGTVYRVRQEGPQAIAFTCGPLDEQAAAPLLTSYLRLDDDLPALYRRLRGDRRLGAAMRQYEGLRLVRQAPWECLVTFVISAYSNIPRIARHVEDLAQTFGDTLEFAGETHHRFPSPAQLAETGEPWFREHGFGYRARYLSRLSVLVMPLGDLTALRRAPFQEARSVLLALPGVGEKVADCVLAFSLDQGEAFPVDVHVRRAVQVWYGEGEERSDRWVREWAHERFGPDAAYAQQYLFHYQRQRGR